MLILSEFAGAAQTLGSGAILINPFNTAEVSQATLHMDTTTTTSVTRATTIRITTTTTGDLRRASHGHYNKNEYNNNEYNNNDDNNNRRSSTRFTWTRASGRSAT